MRDQRAGRDYRIDESGSVALAIVAPQEARLYRYVAVHDERLHYSLQPSQRLTFRAISHANIKLGECETGYSKWHAHTLQVGQCPWFAAQIIDKDVGVDQQVVTVMTAGAGA